MKDFGAIFETYSGKLKTKIGLKTKYGKRFIEDDSEFTRDEFFSRMFYSKPVCLNDFMKFVSEKNIVSVLEIGCAAGKLVTYFSDFFKNKQYTGLDLSSKSIEMCKIKSNFNFICDDFLKRDIDKKFDLVFSFDVVDHVYDVDLFFRKIVQSTKKYAYVHCYRGFFPDMIDHKTIYRDNEGIYMNDVSVKKIESVLLSEGLLKSEFKIHSQIVRDAVLYDGDLGRTWKKSDNDEKKKLLKITGFEEIYLNNLTIGIELTQDAIIKSKTKLTLEILNLPPDYKNIYAESTIVEISRFEKI